MSQREKHSPTSQSNIIAAFRNSLSKSQVGSFIASRTGNGATPLSVPKIDHPNAGYEPDSTTSASSECALPNTVDRQPRRSSLSEVKRVITSIVNPRRSRSGSLASLFSVPLAASRSSATRSRAQTVSSIAVSPSNGSGNSDITPPLTPDFLNTPATSFSDYGATPPDRGYKLTEIILPFDLEEARQVRDPLLSEQIRAGKMPERPICYDTLIADISYESPSQLNLTAVDGIADPAAPGEWVGLEETLELSMRERRASDGEEIYSGEFSKSHNSWAAIHRGSVHPFFADREYLRWKKWHRALDRQSERRRLCRTLTFLEESRKLSDVYVEERITRNWMEYRKDIGDHSSIQLFKEELSALCLYRPDPYWPPVKHDTAWVLKPSLSSSCLRELYTLPVFT